MIRIASLLSALPAVALVAATGVSGPAVQAASAAAAPAATKTVRVVKYKNCAALNKVHPHGVGKPKAKDKTKGRPVTTHLVHAKLYAAQPRTLDRDKDGIACEKL
ncbi:excalibur calcium-binding domain-containing protein [Agilicoccus flavus]|uniref:excalibur calcium-binding domain-containing protein n=1 Tax=Agilicoccus flavus TaxID=2775968 RepID=UPI001CF6E802|nr:excalibur calcium-binding domain-containing protein [Agilicoccus flavus]